MGCGVSQARGFSIEKAKLAPQVRKLLKSLEKETHYSEEELERLWREIQNMSEGRNQERLISTFFTKHKFGHRLIYMILEKEGLDPEKLKKEVGSDEQSDPFVVFPLCVKILGTLRKGSIAEQLQWYFALFDINEDGELSPEEMERMVKVLLENNPTMSDVVTSDVVISKLVNEIFGVADDNGDGVLSLKEFLTHSKFITKKILLQNTSFDQRTKRLIKKIHGDSVNEISFTKYSSPAVELM